MVVVSSNSSGGVKEGKKEKKKRKTYGGTQNIVARVRVSINIMVCRDDGSAGKLLVACAVLTSSGNEPI